MNSEKCRWCGMFHDVRCPWVKAYEFHPDGTVKRVEFVQPVAGAVTVPAQFPQSGWSDNVLSCGTVAISLPLVTR